MEKELPALAPPPPKKQQLNLPMKENVIPENAIVPFEANFNDDDVHAAQDKEALVLSTQNNKVVNNQLKQAPVMFQGATFNNCTFHMNVPQ